MTTKAIGSEIINLGAVELLQGAADPSAGAGVAAPIGSTYYRTTGQQWIKTGAGNTAWSLLGSGGGGVGFQGPWAAGTYQPGAIVTDSNLTLGTTVATSVVPVVTTTLPAVSDATSWQYNGSASPVLAPPPPYGQLISAPSQSSSIISKAPVALGRYIELDCSISASAIGGNPVADAYYIGFLDSALPDTTLPLYLQPGFFGILFWLYTGGGSPQYVVPLVNGSSASSTIVNCSTSTVGPGSYIVYKITLNIFDGLCLLSLVQDGNVIFRQYLSAIPSFASARIAFGGLSGGFGSDQRVWDVVSVTGPNAPWQRLP